jgi:hypothetical protein
MLPRLKMLTDGFASSFSLGCNSRVSLPMGRRCVCRRRVSLLADPKNCRCCRRIAMSLCHDRFSRPRSQLLSLFLVADARSNLAFVPFSKRYKKIKGIGTDALRFHDSWLLSYQSSGGKVTPQMFSGSASPIAQTRGRSGST